MLTEINIVDADGADVDYLTWAPARATIRLVEPGDGNPVDVVLSNDDPSQGGQLEFSETRDQPRATTLNLTLPADGSEVEFYVAGEFAKHSSSDGDAVVKSALVGTQAALSTRPVMVRVRKNANQLSPAERDRFTAALAEVNDQRTGVFRDFRDMHREQLALDQAHGAAGFLSWHRAYLLDLERELQEIDPSVTLPYWRFDEAAPNVFTADFMGQSDPGTISLRFASTNRLRDWQTDGATGVSRSPRFDAQTDSAFVSDQATTLALGGQRPNATFDMGPVPPGMPGGFDEMEGDPHGFAHTSFSGWLRQAGTAPRDPLFFLLHCNVDRLWARWQWFNDRFDGQQAQTFFYRGDVNSPNPTFVGHNLDDTMWPWNNETGGQRPMNAPRTPFPAAPTAPAPGAAPTVGDMIDYLGFLDAKSYMGFCYDDVPYGIAP